MHAGDNLDTPFTGKGIVIGVIDQSFEFKHMGFLDENGKSRIKMLWDRSKDIEKDIQSKAAPVYNVDALTKTTKPTTQVVATAPTSPTSPQEANMPTIPSMVLHLRQTLLSSPLRLKTQRSSKTYVP